MTDGIVFDDHWLTGGWSAILRFLRFRELRSTSVLVSVKRAIRFLVAGGCRNTGRSGEPLFLGDYPKFGMWPDAYYLSMNEFSNRTTFNGVRVYALDLTAWLTAARQTR